MVVVLPTPPFWLATAMTRGSGRAKRPPDPSWGTVRASWRSPAASSSAPVLAVAAIAVAASAPAAARPRSSRASAPGRGADGATPSGTTGGGPTGRSSPVAASPVGSWTGSAGVPGRSRVLAGGPSQPSEEPAGGRGLRGGVAHSLDHSRCDRHMARTLRQGSASMFPVEHAPEQAARRGSRSRLDVPRGTSGRRCPGASAQVRSAVGAASPQRGGGSTGPGRPPVGGSAPSLRGSG